MATSNVKPDVSPVKSPLDADLAAAQAATAKVKPTLPAAITVPAANITAAPAKGRTVNVAGIVGGMYGVTVSGDGPGAPGAAGTVTLPYKVPAWAGKDGAPVSIAVASTAPNWLGVNGLPFVGTVYTSAGGSVVVQRHGAGVKVNAYPAHHRDARLSVEAL